MKPSQAIKFTRPLRITQARTLDRFAYEKEAGLFHEMGCGKTTEAIALLRAKYNVSKGVTPTLIISPAATLYNWVEEFKINSPQNVVRQCEVVYGSEVKRIDSLLNPDKNIFVTNPEFLDMETALKVLKQRQIKNLVVDEVDVFKSHKSQRFQALVPFVDASEFRVIMSGTPILNSYLDLWALFRILDRGETFSTNFFLFRQTYFKDENAWMQNTKKPIKYFPKWVPKDENIAEILSAKIEAKCSRLKKTDCLDLPPLVEVTEYVELSPAQRKLYEQMETELVAEVSEGICSASNALVRVGRMLQILSGYLQIKDGTGNSFAAYIKDNPRLQRLRDHLEQLTPAHKVIVWAVHSENYTMIRSLCDKLNLKYAEVTGEIMGAQEKQDQVMRFQNDPDCRVMLSHPRAGGVGTNMTASTYSIDYSYGYSLRERLQSGSRNHRGGSEIHEKITRISLAVRGALDEDVLKALLRKEDFAEDVLDRIRKRFASKIAVC